jgi:hypothetical protein
MMVAEMAVGKTFRQCALDTGEVALALWVGTGLVLSAGNEQALRMYPTDAWGIPASEAFPGTYYQPMIAAVRSCFATGASSALRTPYCWVTFDRVTDPRTGRPAVVTAARAMRPMPELPDVAPRILDPLRRR